MVLHRPVELAVLFREFDDGLRIDVKAIVGSFGEASSRAQEVPLPPNKESRWNENHRRARIFLSSTALIRQRHTLGAMFSILIPVSNKNELDFLFNSCGLSVV